MTIDRAPIAILYQDSDLIVADKPAGLPTQADPGSPENLLGRLAQQLALPSAGLLPVHRLDRPVGGLLVIARTAAAQTALTRQLASHEMSKVYLAVACGVPEPAAGELADYLLKNERLNISRVTGADNRSAKPARLSYCTLARSNAPDGQALALLRIDLQTGRHHQIRVQLAHAGWPLWGDTKYNPALRRAGGWHNLGLFAAAIRFRHPRDGRPLAFSRELPQWPPFDFFTDLHLDSVLK